MVFVEAGAFTRHFFEYLTEDELNRLQQLLVVAPTQGVVIPGTGGLRKLRSRTRKRQQGRRGGLRVIYFYFEMEAQIWLVTLYEKSEADDLTFAQKKALSREIEAEKRERRDLRKRRGQ